MIGDRPRLVLAGGSGFLGRALARHFVAEGWNVVTVSRSAPAPLVGRWAPWDGLRQGRWSAELDGADAVVNLAGRPVNCRYTAANMLELYTSRLDTTRAVGRAIEAARRPPRVWLNASSATVYRDARDRDQDEPTGRIGDGFSVDVVRRWEGALWASRTPGTRQVALRAGMVYGPGADGVMALTDRLVRLGLAGPMAGGGQYMSWLHERDFVRAVAFLIGRADLAGPVNVTAPRPVTNAEFFRAYRAAWGAPVGLPSSAWMLHVGAAVLGSEAELLLKSRRVVPRRLLDAGFVFDFPTWPEAIRDLVARVRAPGRETGPA